MVKAEVSGRERGVGGVREVLQDQKVSHWLPGEDTKVHSILLLCKADVSNRENRPGALISYSAFCGRLHEGQQQVRSQEICFQGYPRAEGSGSSGHQVIRTGRSRPGDASSLC